MAFVHRTTRDTSKAGATYETPAHIGPGAYKIRSGFGKVRPSFAPFGSTGVRKAETEKVKLVTPGPGTYDERQPRLGVSGNASAFRSATRRFTGTAGGRDAHSTPGPGQYDSTAALDNLHNQGRIKTRKTVKRHTFKLAGTAPSIPGKFDQYGYDETPQGTLRKQVAPSKGHKGRDGDTVGPGEYETTKPIAATARGGADFSRSTTTRNDSKAEESAHLGPGYYDISGESNKRYKRPPNQSGAFKSTTQRHDPSASLATVNSPGPGAYVPPSCFKTQKKRPSLQFFGSSTARFEDRRLRTAGGAPGPGTYRLSNGFTKRNVRRQEPGVGFTNSSRRFQTKYETLGAGPARTSPDVYSFTNNLERKPTGRCASFGTTTKKFFSPTARDKAPGPGAYADLKTDSPQVIFAVCSYICACALVSQKWYA